jgi:hypothetical protein
MNSHMTKRLLNTLGECCGAVCIIGRRYPAPEPEMHISGTAPCWEQTHANQASAMSILNSPPRCLDKAFSESGGFESPSFVTHILGEEPVFNLYA